MIDKWKFSENRECFKCRCIIEEEDVEDERMVTGCPYCKASFVE